MELPLLFDVLHHQVFARQLVVVRVVVEQSGGGVSWGGGLLCLAETMAGLGIKNAVDCVDVGPVDIPIVC